MKIKHIGVFFAVSGCDLAMEKEKSATFMFFLKIYGILYSIICFMCILTESHRNACSQNAKIKRVK